MELAFMQVLEYRRHVIGLALALMVSLCVISGVKSESPLVATNARAFDIKEVDPGGAKALIDEGGLVIDVRSREAFTVRHISGAMLIPLDELPAALAARFDVTRDKPIVIYCGEGVRKGPEATAILNRAGFVNAVNLKGGMEGWKRAGMPTAVGPI